MASCDIPVYAIGLSAFWRTIWLAAWPNDPMIKRLLGRLSMRQSMVLLMGLVTLPMIGLIADSVQKNHEQSIAKSSFVLSKFAATEGADFERTLNESREVLQKLAERPDIRALDPHHCPPILTDIKQLFSRYANVAVADKDGRIVCSVTPINAGMQVSVSGQAWFAQIKKNNAFTISEPHWGPVSGKWVLALNQPIRDNEGRFAGIVGYSLDLGSHPLLRRIWTLPEGLVLTVVNRQGTVILQSENGADTPGQKFSDAQALSTFADMRPATQVIRDGPEQRLVAVSALGDNGFRVYSVRPMRYITQAERNEALRQLTIVISLAGLSILFALYIGRRFSRELEKMAHAASLVANGDLTRRISVEGTTELADLARDFNHMLDVRLQAEARYQSLFEAASDGVVVVDSTSRIILANSRAHQIFGYAAGELIHQHLGVLLPEYHRAIHAQHVDRYFASPWNRPMSEARQGRRKNGDVFKCEINLASLKGAEGPIFSAVIRDLSQIERVSRRYFTAIDTAIDGYAVLSSDGKFLESNSALTRLCGYSNRELRSMTISDLDLQCTDGQTMLILDDCAQHGSGRFETIWRAKDGALIDIELSYSHHDEDGEIFCFIRDISAGRKAELALGMSNARVRNLERAINEHAIVAIINECGNITFANEKYCAISQYSRNELVGQNYLTNDRTLCGSELRLGPQGISFNAQTWSGEIKNHAKDGSCYWVDSTIVPFKDGSGRHTEYFIIQTDITRQKQIEKDLLQSTEQLRHLLARHREVKEEERMRIAREIHDDLGGLLHGIQSHLSVALKPAVSSEFRQDDLISDAIAMADQAMQSVRNIIAELRPSVLDQLGVWAAVESHVGQIEERSQLRCQVMIDPLLDEESLSEEGRIAAFRIIQELMMNVLRHADASMVEVEVTRMKDHVLISVMDDGKGIDPAQILGEHSWGIMGMYERARYCGGELRIARGSNRGTTAVLKLPLEKAYVQ